MPDFIFSKMIDLHINFFGALGDPCNLSGNPDNNAGFFGFPHWWKYLDGERDGIGGCMPTVDLSNGLEPLWAIGLAVVDILLRLAGMLAVGYIIFAGYVFIRSAGSPDKVAAARGKIQSAVVGLIIVVISIAVVNFLGNSLKG